MEALSSFELEVARLLVETLHLEDIQPEDIAPEEALFVGDRLVDDIGGAQGAGLRAVHKASRDREERSDTVVPDATITTLTELWDIVQR